MNRNRQLRRHSGLLLLGAALLLRAAIPAGYMPAAAGTGLLFELCPENVPVEIMQMLAGDHGQHQHHADHGDEDHRCPVGHLLLSAFAVDNQVQFAALPAAPGYGLIPEYFRAASAPRTAYRSRGPPA